MPEENVKYLLGGSERGMFVEIYFPKRAAYQGAIFNALRMGYHEQVVRTYLRHNIVALLEEMRVYRWIFDPHYYDSSVRKTRRTPVSVAEAVERIDTYHSPFRGWSMYTVEGVFFDSEGAMQEETTQVVRLMFRIESSLREEASEAGCSDVLRAILFWTVRRQGRLLEHREWSKAELGRFLKEHGPWRKHKLAFARRRFADIVKETARWMDDCVLFVAYLVRSFAGQVLAERMREEEIWVTTFFNLTINVVTRFELEEGS